MTTFTKYKIKPYVLSFIGATHLLRSSVVDGTGQIVLDDLQCTGNESRLIDCSHNGLGNHNCIHANDAGVRCVPGNNFNQLSTELSIDSYSMHTVCGIFTGPFFQFFQSHLHVVRITLSLSMRQYYIALIVLRLIP